MHMPPRSSIFARRATVGPLTPGIPTTIHLMPKSQEVGAPPRSRCSSPASDVLVVRAVNDASKGKLGLVRTSSTGWRRAPWLPCNHGNRAVITNGLHPLGSEHSLVFVRVPP